MAESGTRKELSNARLVCLSSAPLFKGLCPDELAVIGASARERRVAHKQPISSEAEPAREVALLCAGRAKITQLSGNGEIVILRLAVPGEVVGGLGLAPGAPHPSTAETLEPCDVLAWDTQAFEDLSDRFPVLQRNALRILAGRVRDLEQRYRELATETVAPRLARTLLRLLGQIGRPYGGAVLIGLTREELGQLTGTTLFTVSRLLSQWEACGFLKAGRESVIVSDPSGLAGVASESDGGDAPAWNARGGLIRVRP